ncbi:ABC transporter permease subunit [Nonomuraea rubra]|uniref:ABC transporter permease subunit n=1 Tax=Nonomuraea rubra TaxID=46180 RepID=UPI003CD07F92
MYVTRSSPASRSGTTSPAARIAGVSRLRILRRHVLPNIAEPLIVNATMGAGGVLLSFAGLSFLGTGRPGPVLRLGQAHAGRAQRHLHQPPGALGPGFAVIVAGLAFKPHGRGALATAFGLGRGHRAPPRRGRIRAAGRRDPRPPRHSPPRARPVGGRPAGDDPRRPAAHPRGTRRHVRRPGKGEAVGVVGESGSGKSMTALAVARLIEEPIRVEAGHLAFAGEDLLAAGDTASLRRRLGTSLAVVFQGPDDVLQPGAPGGAAAGRGEPLPPGPEPQGGVRPGGRPAARGQDPRAPNGAPGSTPSSSPGACASGR